MTVLLLSFENVFVVTSLFIRKMLPLREIAFLINFLSSNPGFGFSSRHLDTKMARMTGLEPATSAVTGRRSNQLSYTLAKCELLSI